MTKELDTFDVDVYQRERFVIRVKAHNEVEAEAIVNEILFRSGTPDITDEAWDATEALHGGVEDVWTIADTTGDIKLTTGDVEYVEEPVR